MSRGKIRMLELFFNAAEIPDGKKCLPNLRACAIMVSAPREPSN
jgi:hypothetical protein